MQGEVPCIGRSAAGQLWASSPKGRVVEEGQVVVDEVRNTVRYATERCNCMLARCSRCWDMHVTHLQAGQLLV